MEFALRVGPAIGSLGQPSCLFSRSSSPYALFSGSSPPLHQPVLNSSTGADVAEPVLESYADLPPLCASPRPTIAHGGFSRGLEPCFIYLCIPIAVPGGTDVE